MNWHAKTGPIGKRMAAGSDWPTRLAELSEACAGGRAMDESRRIREAFGLLQDAPRRMTSVAGADPETPIEAMLAAGAVESAALALLPADAGFMLSRGPNGVHIASVCLAECTEEWTADGETAALALVAALLAAVSCAARAASPRDQPTRLQ